MRLSMPRPPHRLERLRAWMEDEKLDCAVVFGIDNVNHLSGYWRYFGGPSALVVGRDGERTLVVMLDEARIASELASADEVIGFGERGFGIDLDPVAGLIASVAAVPVVASAQRLGVSSELPGAEDRFSRAVSAEVADAGDILYRLRLIKDEDELEKILASYELCWIGHQAIAEGARPGAQEIELFTAAQSAAQIASGGPIEFVCDLLSGPNAAEVCCPIHVAGRRAAEEGDAIVADVVVRSNGYWGDSAETHIAGSNDEVSAVRDELLVILDGARAQLVPGAKGSDVFRDVNERILSTFPGGEFPHHGGHALGLTGFEDPHIIPSDETPFEPWMVLAVEPGVYFPGRYGARVENVFIVTSDGGLELRQAFEVSNGGG
jgi:Xaa-Pro aminopeptidase